MAYAEFLDDLTTINEDENCGWRPLHEAAACHSDIKYLEDLLERGSDSVNCVTLNGETALLLASKNQGKSAEKAVSLLLHAGADANIADCRGETPLLVAISARNFGVVVQLLNFGRADPDLGDWSQRRPLHAAAEEGHLEIMKCLLKAKASIDVENEHGKTPIFTAANYGRTECLKELLKVAVERGQKQIIDTKNPGTPLMIAAQQGFTECVQVLLDYNADPNLHTVCLRAGGLVTALHKSLYGDHVDCLELLTNKVNLLHHTSKHISLLHLAVELQSYKCLQVLLLGGLDVNSLHDREQTVLDRMYILSLPNCETALSFAACREDTECMKILLDYGASVNSVDNSGMYTMASYPPVFTALFNGTWEALDLLIEHDCNISYHRDTVPSNECLLFSFYDYNATKKLLICGSDSHLCFQNGNAASQMLFVDCLSSIAITREQNLVPKILELLLLFTVITEPVQDSFYAVAERCAKIFTTEYSAERWNVVLMQIKKPTSLKNLCRIKTRQQMISLHGYSSFRTKINCLQLPHSLKEYLLYSELDQSCRDPNWISIVIKSLIL